MSEKSLKKKTKKEILEQRNQKKQPMWLVLYAMLGYAICDLILAIANYLEIPRNIDLNMVAFLFSNLFVLFGLIHYNAVKKNLVRMKKMEKTIVESTMVWVIVVLVLILLFVIACLLINGVSMIGSLFFLISVLIAITS